MMEMSREAGFWNWKVTIGDVVKVVTLLGVIASAYYDMHSELKLVKQQTEQETKGYYAIQAALGQELQNLRGEIVGLRSELRETHKRIDILVMRTERR